MKHSILLIVRNKETMEVVRPLLTAISGCMALADWEEIDWEASRQCARTLLFETGEVASPSPPPRAIVLRHCHDQAMAGKTFTMEHGETSLDIPMVCGCVATFAPAGWTEKDGDDVEREVWKQVDLRFCEYREPL